MKSFRTFIVLLMAVFAVLVSTAAVLAQTPVPGQVTDDQVNAVAKELFCPVCENIPLDVCPTQACVQWRDLIRQKLSIGWSKDQIKEYFRQQYGDRVLAEPPREGLNWLVYILPPVFFLVGVYLVYRVMSKRKPAVPLSSADCLADAGGRRPVLEAVGRRTEENVNERLIMEKTESTPTPETKSTVRSLPAYVIVAAFALLIGFLMLIGWGLNRAQQPPIQVGDMVPPFTLSTFDGKEVNLAGSERQGGGGQFLGILVQTLRAGSRRYAIRLAG